MLLRRALALSLTLELTPYQVSHLLWQAARDRKNRANLYAWITSEWSRIRTKWKDDVLWPVLGVAKLACSDEERKTLEGVFVGVSINQWNWLRDRLREAMDCRDLRDYASPATSAYLRSSSGTKAR